MASSDAVPEESKCRCGHTRHWHGQEIGQPEGSGGCEGGNCECKRFSPAKPRAERLFIAWGPTGKPWILDPGRDLVTDPGVVEFVPKSEAEAERDQAIQKERERLREGLVEDSFALDRIRIALCRPGTGTEGSAIRWRDIASQAIEEELDRLAALDSDSEGES